MLVLGLTLGGTTLFSSILGADGLTVVDLVALALFGVLFGHLSCAFLLAVAGFARGLRPFSGRRPNPFPLQSTAASPRSRPSRTAVVMAIRHEDVGRVQAGVRVILSEADLCAGRPLDDPAGRDP